MLHFFFFEMFPFKEYETSQPFANSEASVSAPSHNSNGRKEEVIWLNRSALFICYAVEILVLLIHYEIFNEK